MRLILIVEDEVTLSLLAAMTLEDEGYRVVTAFNGARGIEAARRHAPDLVVTDYMMPVMDGVEMIRRLRADGYSAPILLTSAVAELQIPGREDLGYDAFLPKPYHENRLIRMIGEHLADRTPDRDTAPPSPSAR